MHVALYARVSTADKDQNPETQLRPLREHLLHLQSATDAGTFVDHASADNLRGRKEWRRLLEFARRRQVDPIVVWKLDRARAEGTHVGRPKRMAPVTAHAQWAKVLAGIEAGHLTRTEAARKLHVRRATRDAALAAVPKEILPDRQISRSPFGRQALL